MSRFVAFLLLLVVIVSIHAYHEESFEEETHPEERCGPNEVFQKCGSTCEPTCKTHSPRFCLSNCKFGCFCKEGYIRNSDGECILTRDC